MKFFVYIFVVLCAGVLVCTASSCSRCIKQVSETCTTEERTLINRDYGCGSKKDNFDANDPTNEWNVVNFNEIIVDQFLNVPELQELLQPFLDFFNITPPFRYEEQPRTLNLEAFTISGRPSVFPLPNYPDFFNLGISFGYLVDFWDNVEYAKSIPINPKGSVRTEVEISTQFLGFETHPFCGEGNGPTCDIVPNYLNDYRLGAVYVILSDVLGISYSASEVTNPLFSNNFNVSVNNQFQAMFILTKTGIWVSHGLGHTGDNPNNPLFRMRPLANAVKFIRYYTEQNILKLGLEWDSQCKQLRYYVDGDLVEVVGTDEIGLPQNLVMRANDTWQYGYFSDLDQLQRIDNLNPMRFFIQAAKFPFLALNNRALYEDTFFSHMRTDTPLDFPVAAGEVINGTCVATEESDYEYVSAICSVFFDGDPSNDYVVPNNFYDWGQQIKYSVYGFRVIQRDNCDAYCKIGTIEGISDQDF